MIPACLISCSMNHKGHKTLSFISNANEFLNTGMEKKLLAMKIYVWKKHNLCFALSYIIKGILHHVKTLKLRRIQNLVYLV